MSDRRAAVVVTGSSGAMGCAVGDLFLSRGYAVIGIDSAPDPAADRPGYQHLYADVRDYSRLVEAAASLSSGELVLRAVVGVAGGAAPGEVAARHIETLDIELFRASLELNLVSQYAVIRAFYPYLKKCRESSVDRSVTVISSVNGLIGMDMPAYSAAKAGVVGMVRVLAKMLGPEGIRVNAVAPGTVPTPRTERIWADDPGHFERLRNESPIRRLTTPSEVAAAVWAVSVDLTAMTGQTIVVDAGQTAVWNY